MPESDSYGEAFGRRLNAAATSFVTRAFPTTTIAVTELRYETPQNVLSTPPIEEDAYLAAVVEVDLHVGVGQEVAGLALEEVGLEPLMLVVLLVH